MTYLIVSFRIFSPYVLKNANSLLSTLYLFCYLSSSAPFSCLLTVFDDFLSYYSNSVSIYYLYFNLLNLTYASCWLFWLIWGWKVIIFVFLYCSSRICSITLLFDCFIPSRYRCSCTVIWLNLFFPSEPFEFGSITAPFFNVTCDLQLLLVTEEFLIRLVVLGLGILSGLFLLWVS